jgi:hypothetical protein
MSASEWTSLRCLGVARQSYRGGDRRVVAGVGLPATRVASSNTYSANPRPSSGELSSVGESLRRPRRQSVDLPAEIVGRWPARPAGACTLESESSCCLTFNLRVDQWDAAARIGTGDIDADRIANRGDWWIDCCTDRELRDSWWSCRRCLSGSRLRRAGRRFRAWSRGGGW